MSSITAGPAASFAMNAGISQLSTRAILSAPASRISSGVATVSLNETPTGGTDTVTVAHATKHVAKATLPELEGRSLSRRNSRVRKRARPTLLRNVRAAAEAGRVVVIVDVVAGR